MPPRKAKGRRGKGLSREARKRRGAAAKARRPQGKPYEFLPHPADVGFLARGKTLQQVFAAAAQAMCDYGWERSRVRARERIEIRARAATLEDLLYSWLSEVLFLCDAERWVFRRFAVSRVAAASGAGTKAESAPASLWEVQGTGLGEKFDPQRHRPRTYIKAVTYHQLAVLQTPQGWTTSVFLDV